MAQVEATTERTIAADAETVFDALADYKEVRGKVLPGHFSEYEVREGGDGEGSLVHWKLQATSKRVRDCLLEVTEPTDGQLVEKDRNSSMVTTWTVTPMRRGPLQGGRLHRLERRRMASAVSSSGPSRPRASPASTTNCSRTSPPRSRRPRRRGPAAGRWEPATVRAPVPPLRHPRRVPRLTGTSGFPGQPFSAHAALTGTYAPCVPRTPREAVCPAFPRDARNVRRRCDEGSVPWWVAAHWSRTDRTGRGTGRAEPGGRPCCRTTPRPRNCPSRTRHPRPVRPAHPSNRRWTGR